MVIENVAISLIKPYEKNAKKHDKKQIDQVAKSIKAFGWAQPLVVDKNNSLIIGHCRLQAAKKLELAEVPVLRMENLTEGQVQALRLADNRLNESDWDMKLVIDELKLLDEELVDLTGFSQDLIIEADEKDDEVPDVPEEPVSKLGDIYQLGRHRVMCGDSTKLEDVEKLMNGQKADMVFTDPPYGVNFQSNMRTKSDKFDVLKNDDVFISDWIPNVEMFSKGFVFMWTTWKVLDKWIELTQPFGKMTNMVVWHKGGGGIGDLKGTFSTDYEIAMVFNRGAEITGKRIGSVWKLIKDFAGDYKHPTQKPVELPVEAITKTTNAGESVMDLFLGSGSTLIACEKTDRVCYGMELDPKYIDVIIKRWEDYTGEKAVKLQ